MSVSTEVQRTLVKSPPELWTELSTPEGLARHFGDLGEVRVTKVEPESAVQWEAGDATGSVQLKQSGWGTKVTLSLTRTPSAAEPVAETEPTETEPADIEPDPTAESELDEPQPTAEIEPEPIAEPEPRPVAPESVNVIEVRPEPEPVAETPPSPEPKPKRGFFARLFRRSAPRPVAPKPKSAPEAEPIAEPKPEVQALAWPDPKYPDAPEPTVPPIADAEVMAHEAPETPLLHTAGASPAPGAEPAGSKLDTAADLAEIEAQMEQEANELLTGVLDRLGAAHHRPFSRG